MKIGDKFKSKNSPDILEVIDIQVNGEVIWCKYEIGKEICWKSVDEINNNFTPITQPWEPEEGKKYWYVSDFGEIEHCDWRVDKIDNYRLSIGDVFKTEDDPKIEEYKQALLELGKRFNNI